MNSSRTGCASPAGKMSTMPPRTANSPCSSAGSSRVKPASTSSSARSVGAMSWPGFSSSDAPSSRSGALTRGSSAAADATTTRAVPRAMRVQRPGARRGHADVRRQAAVRIDLVRGKRQHRAFRRRPREPLERGEEERRRRRPSARGRRRSARRTARRRAAAPCAAPATYSALADGVRPETAARGHVHPAARDGGLEQRAKVERGRGGHGSPEHPKLSV